MRYPLVLFDFDGTLADSLARALMIYHQIAPGLGLKPIPDVEAARMMPTRKLLRHLGVRFWRLARIVRAYQAAAAEHAHEQRLHPGIADVLRDLHAQGHRLGILSSNREDVIRTCLRINGVEDLFAFVVGYPKLFGKAKALRKILKHEKLDHTKVLFVGDELRDLEAGRKTKVATVAVTWGFHHEILLNQGAPSYLVRTPAEISVVANSPHPLIQIRSYESGDEAAVIALWEQCGLTRPWNDPTKDIRRKQKVRGDLFLIGELEGEIVGTAMAGYEGYRGWISYLGIHPDHRRKGYGRAILAEAERLLRAAGCPKINLQVRTGNDDVVAFYRKLGYSVDEVVSLGKRLELDVA